LSRARPIENHDAQIETYSLQRADCWDALHCVEHLLGQLEARESESSSGAAKEKYSACVSATDTAIFKEIGHVDSEL
jgi:hypothetical protein